MRFCCFVNPRSGGKKGEVLIRHLKDLARSPRFHCEVVEIDFQFLAHQVKNALSFDRIVIAGGDGTFSGFLPFLTNSQIPVGLLPLGTGNDLARELRLLEQGAPREPEDWLSFYASAPIRELTVWKAQFKNELEPFLFINYLSFGYDGEVLSHFESLRSRFGWVPRLFGKHGNRLLYLVAGTKALLHPRLPELTLQADSQTRHLAEHRSILFSNISSVMGIGSSHLESSPYDGKLECSALPGFSQYFGLIAPSLRSFPGGFFEPRCFFGESKWRVAGFSGPLWYQYDGEARKLAESSTLTLCPAGTVRMCCDV